MDEAEFCDRVSIMVDGRIAVLDTPQGMCLSYGVSKVDDVFFKVASKGGAK